MAAGSEAKKRAQRKYYHTHAEERKKKVEERRARLREWFREYKKTLKCSRCDESHWSCLEFHHPNGEDKKAGWDTVNRWISQYGWNEERMIKELSKLEILCANCHRKIHHP